MALNLNCNHKDAAENYGDSDCPYLTASFVFAGLSMMLNIRLAYSSAPYALIRYKLPENLFSVFVRRMASALELWCLPSMLLGNILDTGSKLLFKYYGDKLKLGDYGDGENKSKQLKQWTIIYPSIFTMWSDFITYVVLLVVYLMGGDYGNVTAYYGVIAVSGFIFGINMTLVYAVDFNYIPVYVAGENSFPALTSLIHYFATLIFGNRRKWNSDFLIVVIDISVAITISFITATLWTVSFLSTHQTGQPKWHIHPFDKNISKPHWEVISPTLMVIVGMGLVYAIYPGLAPGMIVPFYLIDKIEMVLLIATIFPPVIVALLIKGSFDQATTEYSPKSAYQAHQGGTETPGFGGWRHYKKHKNKQDPGGVQSPDFSCASNESEFVHNWFWHFFDLLIVIKITLAVIFIYSLHYRDSSLSRSIINQPKMSTILSITFYMCHEILLALGFPGVIGNNGADYVMLPAQYVGALFMIFLAFYSGKEGHPPKDPNQRACQILKLQTKPASGSNVIALTYTIGPDFKPHSKAINIGKRNYKGTVYYLCLVSPCLMVLTGRFSFPNLTIVTRVGIFVNFVEFLFNVLDRCKSNSAVESNFSIWRGV
ncbi:Theileria-specific integral membrane protein, putative [Theileria annulata]|uniref:Theileria-specific integral membrane protein, putative n=1 Tax=Theileria annulata TaxID=5874 RepID=Q4UBF3_THEAN|nr:Theileria-specific integral membrane protein, putative [Theileria annulata]CAI75848.1 Theileria-specific integral membrane protein, putative [Theileria annulata]|eukprot:XP_955324.1 Theileria-specific integral membrane protein, putative [Theileria annulata]